MQDQRPHLRPTLVVAWCDFSSSINSMVTLRNGVGARLRAMWAKLPARKPRLAVLEFERCWRLSFNFVETSAGPS